ncbi:MAG: VOC family protein [Rhodospirillaceae bacterium]
MTGTQPFVSPMVRTALFVSDMQRSAAFYKDVLELEELYAEGALTHATAAKLLGMPPETAIRYKILRSSGLNKGMVGLFELTDPEPPKVHKRANGCSIGETCLVFYCADLDTVMERLIEGGHSIVCPPMRLEVEIEDGALKDAVINSEELPARGMREMTFHDPDGILINLIERDPKSNY